MLVHLLPPLMLIGSNIFMTFAWHERLRCTDQPLCLVAPLSWGLACFSYWLAAPANRIGSGVDSAAQLKGMQAVITLVIFAGVLVFYLGQRIGPAARRFRPDRGGRLPARPRRARGLTAARLAPRGLRDHLPSHA